MVASRPALKNTHAEIKATKLTIKNKMIFDFLDNMGVKKSTFICCPFLIKDLTKEKLAN